MYKMKFIRGVKGSSNLETVVMWPECSGISHAEMSRTFNTCLSAGFVSVNHEDHDKPFVAFGESVTIRLKASDDDTKFINEQYRGY